MRIWHEDLIPKLCNKHLCAMWREGLGLSLILIEDKKGYRNHPATKEFEKSPIDLLERLTLVYRESVKRGLHFDGQKLEPLASWAYYQLSVNYDQPSVPWQTLEEQIEVLKKKGCECHV